ncbi:DNA mismatch endonuclease Vsr [Nocardia testacea]|uniref:very short patch repair endonuclease n=1 Tax=Nocardia testacea TaxID=248551 RepID=UPI003A84D35B
MLFPFCSERRLRRRCPWPSSWLAATRRKKVVADKSRKWKGSLPSDDAWHPPPGLTGKGRTAEQDDAADGRENRVVELGNGRTALASIELKLYPRTRRIRAYIRWSDGGRTVSRYICEVDSVTRQENLVRAWNAVRERRIISAPGQPRRSWASSPAVRSVMRANRNRDTRPEIALRGAIRALGLGYRVDIRPEPSIRRRADVVFLGAKVAVFCDGCFWHGCPTHYRPARQNSEFWGAKIANNRSRDRETDKLLTQAGWCVMRVWEHEDPVIAADRIKNAVLTRRKNLGIASGSELTDINHR